MEAPSFHACAECRENPAKAAVPPIAIGEIPAPPTPAIEPPIPAVAITAPE